MMHTRIKVCRECGHNFFPAKKPTFRKRGEDYNKQLKADLSNIMLIDNKLGDMQARYEHIYSTLLDNVNKDDRVDVKARAEKILGISITDSQNEQLWKCFHSKFQSRKAKAGRSSVAIVLWALAQSLIRYQLEYENESRIDISLVDLNNAPASIKHRMRDRVNDKEHDIQFFILAEINLDTLRLFKKNKTLVIVFNKESKLQCEKKLKKNKIKLRLYSLEEGLQELHRRILECQSSVLTVEPISGTNDVSKDQYFE